VSEAKGLVELLLAFDRVASRRSRPWLWIAGRGTPDEERRHREAAAATPSADRIRWLGHRNDMPDLLAACDVFVFPSHSEGSPLVLMEAMAAGRPIVASDIDAIRDLLAPDLGDLVPVSDPDAIARAITRALDEPERVREQCGRARDHVAREHAAERYAADFAALFRELCAPRAGR
jgi:glycosyltransferase involved in cell wall biosynthesis